MASFWKFAGKRPENTDPASQSHFTLLQVVAAEVKLAADIKTENRTPSTLRRAATEDGYTLSSDTPEDRKTEGNPNTEIRINNKGAKWRRG
jgi:hypothetical protein